MSREVLHNSHHFSYLQFHSEPISHKKNWWFIFSEFTSEHGIFYALRILVDKFWLYLMNIFYSFCFLIFFVGEQIKIILLTISFIIMNKRNSLRMNSRRMNSCRMNSLRMTFFWWIKRKNVQKESNTIDRKWNTPVTYESYTQAKLRNRSKSWQILCVNLIGTM